MESGDLVYTGSRDSLLSNHNSAVSTSSKMSTNSSVLSSERISSSRGSLENLLDKRRSGGGFVNKKKNIFEELCNKQNFRNSQESLTEYKKSSPKAKDAPLKIHLGSRNSPDLRSPEIKSPDIKSPDLKSPDPPVRASSRKFKFKYGSPDPPMRDSSVDKYKYHQNRLSSGTINKINLELNPSQKKEEDSKPQHDSKSKQDQSSTNKVLNQSPNSKHDQSSIKRTSSQLLTTNRIRDQSSISRNDQSLTNKVSEQSPINRVQSQSQNNRAS